MKAGSLVRAVMSRPPITVPERMWFKEVARTMAFQGVGCLPVVDAGGKLVGLVTEEDLLLKISARRCPPLSSSECKPVGGCREHYKAQATTAAELMTAPVVTVRPDLPLSEAAALMRERDVRHLVVVDAAERPVGVLSRRDLMRVFLRPDREIQAEIDDLLLRRLGERRIEVVATVRDGVVTVAPDPGDDPLLADTVEEMQEIEGVVAVRTMAWDEAAPQAAPRTGMP